MNQARPPHHPVWTAAFLGITGAAVTMELVAAYTKREDLYPWCHFAVRYIPKPVALAGAAVLSVWLPGHLARSYKKAGKL